MERTEGRSTSMRQEHNNLNYFNDYRIKSLRRSETDLENIAQHFFIVYHENKIEIFDLR